MQDLFGQPLFYIYFIYGLSFITMAFLLARGIERATSVAIVSTFFMLAVFGLVHGLVELIDWLRFIMKTVGAQEIVAVTYLSQGGMVISFVFLLQFGINLLTYRMEKKTAIRSIPVLLFILYIAGIYYFGVSDVLKAGLIGRHAFGFTGAALTAVALFGLSRSVKDLNNPKLERGLVVGAVAFLLYGVFGGLLVQPLFGLPIQLFRAACAVVITVSFMFVLDVFKLFE